MIEDTPVVAITGTIASGKSLVGKLLQERGFPVIDTDQIVHDLFEHSQSLQAALQERFGNDIVIETANGQRVDRPKLGALVFADEQARHALESIVHPATIAECDRQVRESAQNNKAVFVLVPLLYEAGQEGKYDQVWSVRTDETVLRQRLKQRNNLTDEQIDARLAAQLPQAEKAKRADKVIDNSGTIDDTAKQIDSLVADLA